MISTTAVALLLLLPFYHTMSRMFAPEALSLLANNLIHWWDGPYLRPEMARHLFFSGIVGGLLWLVLGSGRIPKRAAFGAIYLLLVADLFLMRSLGGQYFAIPRDFFQAGAPVSALTQVDAELGEFRTMGYARNGTLHFLSDFPANVLPPLSPPNLAMVYSQEDVQGYNPLQLRRYADYLVAVNGGPEDYHWALVYNLQSRLLDLLNLGYVALRGDDSRLRNVTVATGLNLETSGQSLTVRTRPILASGLQLHSYLGHSADLEDGRVAARLHVSDAAGRTWSFDVRAGVETAEWAYDRPDVRARVHHQRARVSMTWNLPTPVHTYVADLTFPEPVEVVAVTLERVEPDIFIVVPELAAVPLRPIQRYEEVPVAASTGPTPAEGILLFRNRLALPRALLVPRAEMASDSAAVLARLQDDGFEPRRTVVLEGEGTAGRQGDREEVGRVAMVSRANNRVRLAVNSTSYGFLLLNELSYPGWNAYLDGEPTRVWRANYLFRAIEITPGAHQVEFRFEPDSVKLGLALTLSTLAIFLMAAALGLKARRQRKENRSDD